ncbi:HEAT repeat domain-containing protein [uncultured Methanoregula sp.]|uniref:HEAT repeat domain-containing protein n=1 Tax=uncultured Methanoregula sp. TaxID=1005933 RepID=UPI002AAB5647|nr:HEAT repeat domain-containing protein [uncultured Methanoregula sp.]
MTAIESLKQSRDIHGLIRLLDHKNPDTQWKAADALGSLGEAACDPLIRILEFPKMHVRLGAIEALGDIQCPRSVEPVIRRLKEDKDNEIRFVAALALGQIGDPRALASLEEALQDPDRYVRYGAVMSLEMLSWTPDDETTLAYMLIAQQEWETLRGMKEAATGPLIKILKDPNPKTRQKIVELLGEIGGPDATKACEGALMDRDPGVRWRAVLACGNCGVPRHIIPQILANRPRTTPSALGAAVLNLFFFGLGYNYIGKWWGFPVFMFYMTNMVFLQLYTGLWFPYIFVYPFTAISAVHTYYTVKRMPDM